MNLSRFQLQNLMKTLPKMRFSSVVALSQTSGIDLTGLINIRLAAKGSEDDEAYDPLDEGFYDTIVRNDKTKTQIPSKKDDEEKEERVQISVGITEFANRLKKESEIKFSPNAKAKLISSIGGNNANSIVADLEKEYIKAGDWKVSKEKITKHMKEKGFDESVIKLADNYISLKKMENGYFDGDLASTIRSGVKALAGNKEYSTKDEQISYGLLTLYYGPDVKKVKGPDVEKDKFDYFDYKLKDSEYPEFLMNKILEMEVDEISYGLINHKIYQIVSSSVKDKLKYDNALKRQGPGGQKSKKQQKEEEEKRRKQEEEEYDDLDNPNRKKKRKVKNLPKPKKVSLDEDAEGEEGGSFHESISDKKTKTPIENIIDKEHPSTEKIKQIKNITMNAANEYIKKIEKDNPQRAKAIHLIYIDAMTNGIKEGYVVGSRRQYNEIKDRLEKIGLFKSDNEQENTKEWEALRNVMRQTVEKQYIEPAFKEKFGPNFWKAISSSKLSQQLLLRAVSSNSIKLASRISKLSPNLIEGNAKVFEVGNPKFAHELYWKIQDGKIKIAEVDDVDQDHLTEAYQAAFEAVQAEVMQNNLSEFER